MSDLDRGFRLGQFEVRPLEGTVTGPDGARHLQPKVMQVLKCLAASAGQVVDRNSLMDTVWGRAVVGDEALNRCISEIRNVLGDDSTRPRYVQTIPRVGYKLLGETRPLPGAEPAADSKSPITRYALPVAAFAVIIAAAVFIWGEQSSESSFALEDNGTVLLAGLVNRTGDTLFDDSLPTALRIGLNQTQHFRVVPEAHVHAALRRMQKPTQSLLSRQTANELAIREGFNAVLVAEVALIGDGYTVAVEVVDPASDRTLLARAQTVEQPQEVISGLNALTRGVRQALGESLEDIEAHSEPLEKVTTSNLEALRAYSLAIRKHNEGQPEEAIALLRRAIGLDPEFAIAHARLGTYLANIDTTPAAAASHWDIALSLSERLPEREKLYIEGARAMKSSAADMREAWSLMSTLYPNDPVGHSNLGAVYWYHYNNFDAAEIAFANAAVLDGRSSPIGMSMVAYMKMARGELDDALAHFAAAWEIENNPLNSAYAEAYIADFQYDKAKAFLTATGTHSSQAIRDWSALKWTNLYLDQGQLQSALSATEAVVRYRREKDMSLHRARTYKVAVLEQSADTEAFTTSLTELIADLTMMLNQPANALADRPVMPLALLGKVAARNGLAEQAQGVRQTLLPYAEQDDFPMYQPALAALDAELLILMDKPAAAVTMLQPELRNSDLYQLHETMARACEAAGDHACATTHYQWIHDNRGRAFGEWYSDFFAKPFNVADWGRAKLALARVANHVGEKERAQQHYRALLSHWANADDDMPALQQVRAAVSPQLSGS